MPISYNDTLKRFHLSTRSTSYLFELAGGLYPIHLYWGPAIRELHDDPVDRMTIYNRSEFSLHEHPLDVLPQECPVFGANDLRPGMLHVIHADGSHTLDLTYVSHEILTGKPEIPGMPGARADGAETLILTLQDRETSLFVDLFYTVWEAHDLIARRVRVRNEAKTPVALEQVSSLCVDFENADMDILTLNGAWSRERDINRRPLASGIQGTSTERGASSMHTSPFLALLSHSADETSGEVYGFALCYSGSFSATVSVDQFNMARAAIGINPFNFRWMLNPGESFDAPEAYMVYSHAGLGGMSHIFHRFIHDRVTPGKFARSTRPILINNWEATYFGFNEDKLISMARCAAAQGIDLFVLDDGWFGHRDSDNSSLGDWFVDLRKLPHGLKYLSDTIHSFGMKFGLWFEPEMISRDSKLYEAHPDWCIHSGNRLQVESRHQLVLDLSRQEVRDYIVERVSDVIRSGGVDYVKWDMNRNISMWGSSALPTEQQQELGHRYILGVYDIMNRITRKFPDVLFESCASGGGRFDLGILCLMPQTWCSDDTDAWMRCRIQMSTSLVFPPSTMGAHVSAVPNHQTGRNTPLSTRAAVAMCGTFGYELDIEKLSEEELAEIRRFNEQVHQWQPLLFYGQFYRLRDPFTTNEAAWMVVSEDRREAIVTHVYGQSVSYQKPRLLRLQGLDSSLDYVDEATGTVYGGDELMSHGIAMNVPWNDYLSQQFHLIAR